MRILVITAHDAVNLSIENVVRELLRRGHQIDIFARRMEDRHIRMFKDLPISIRPVSELRDVSVAGYDCAFCPMDGVGDLAFHNIYIFSYNFLFSNRWASPSGDFMFMQTENRPVVQWEDCARMAVGSPKNDAPRKPAHETRSILFIDTGHFPFIMEGKVEIADMLLSICRRFPTHKLVVKPRWLPTETNDIHVSRIHLYDVIEKRCEGRVPENLVLLNEHRDMQELIDEADVVITPGSTAYFEAAMRGKKVLIVDGFQSGDSINARKETVWDLQLEIMRESGCVVDYRNVLDYLPDGLSCSEDHFNKIATYGGNVSEAVADAMEYICRSMLARGKFPAVRSYSLQDYREMLTADSSINFIVLKKKRMKNHALRISRRFDWVTAKIDYSPWLQTLNAAYDQYRPDADGLRALKARMETELNLLWLNAADRLREDPIDQAVLFKAMDDEGRLEEIVNTAADTVLCRGPYNYYLAKYSANSSVKIQCFLDYLTDVYSRPYEMYPQDSAACQKEAYNYLFRVYNGTNIGAAEILTVYKSLYEMHLERHVAFKNRKRIHDFLPGIARELLPSSRDQAFDALELYARYENLYNIRELKKRIVQLEKENKAIRQANEGQAIRPSRSRGVGGLLRKWQRFFQRGVRCIRDKGLPYAFGKVREAVKSQAKKVKQKIAEISAIKIYRIFHDRVMAGYKLYAGFTKKYGENARLLLSCNGTGDAYLFGMIYRAYVQKFVGDGAVPVFAVFEKTGEKVARQFFDIQNVEPYSYVDFKWLWNLLMFDKQRLAHVESMHYHNNYRHVLILQRLDGLHGFNIVSELLAYLDMDARDMDDPKVAGDPAYLSGLFADNGLIPGKTAVLAPYAKSFRPIPQRTWTELARLLAKKGFTVCTNSVGAKEPAIPGTVPLLVPHAQAIPFLEMAGACIGLRSGFLDIVSSAKCLKIAVYNEGTFSWGQVGDPNEVFFLSGMYRQPRQFDLVWHPQEEEDFLTTIVSLVTDALEGS